MLNYIAEHLATILIGLAVLTAFVLIVVSMIKKKKKGQTTGCGCGCCSGACDREKHC